MTQYGVPESDSRGQRVLLPAREQYLPTVRALLAEREAWEEVTFTDPAQAPISYAHPAQAV